MMLEVPWEGLWTLSFGFSQFHGHGFWLMCEVALSRVICKVLQGGHVKDMFIVILHED
jgi:hypothetical protein